MTQAVVCSKCGQSSSESDFCSECGARIDGTSLPAPVAAPLAVGECPECRTPRPSADARFCEVCRYDFVKQAAGDPPVVAAATPPVILPSSLTWDVVVSVDPGLDTDPDPELKPPEEPERRIPLDKPENLIGRRDANQTSVPDVRPHDPSVSRRHAKLLVHTNGSVAILDLESANGTFVNGEQILAGMPHELTEGDVVTMGRWTRLRIEPRVIA